MMFIKKYSSEILLSIFAVSFSFWLMFHTFSYSNGIMYIGTKAWSDFGSHIPLIRSFSLGDNFPPQYPLFPGEPIRYHFIFYAFVGLLERVGIRIDYALNIPSVILFTGLILVIYYFAKALFRSKAVGLLSVAFFLCNGSLSFLEFFKDHPLSTKTIGDIVTNNVFPSFAPYGKGIVSAFWNLNIYTNQRHLAGAYFLSFLLLFFFLKPILQEKKISIAKSGVIGLVLGLSFFFHMAVLLMTVIVIAFCFLVFPRNRIASLIVLMIAGIVAFPQYLTMRGNPSSSFFIHAGYLISNGLTPLHFLSYWFFNLGFHMLLIPLGFLVAPKNAKKILFCFIPIFIIGNTIQFSPEIAANHKLFNYFMLVGNMFSAYFLFFLWRKRTLFKPLVICLFFLLTFSGVIDFFPILNDVKGTLVDYPKSPDITWIMKHTPRDAVFLNSSYFYHPASLAGRKIFLGWPYFAWSQGYDTLKRDTLRKKLLSGDDITLFCQEAKKYDLSFVVTEQIDKSEDYTINKTFFAGHFPKVYENKEKNFVIYATKPGC